MDQLHAYNSNVEPLYYTTRFIDGLKDDIKYFIVVQRPKYLDTACCLALLQEENGVIQSKELKFQGYGTRTKPFLKGALPLPRPPIATKPNNAQWGTRQRHATLGDNQLRTRLQL
jgi:hypothetical protein